MRAFILVSLMQGDYLYVNTWKCLGILTSVREMSGILLKIREVSGKTSCQEKSPKTVYC